VPQRGHFRQSQSGLDGSEQKGVVAASQPLRSIRRRQQRLDLWPGQEIHECASLSLVWNRQHSLDDSAVRRRLQRGRSGKTTGWPSNGDSGFWHHCDGGFPDLPGTPRPKRHPDRPAPTQKGPCVPVFGRTCKQQPECVAIGGDGVRADFPLRHQTSREERLQQGRKISGPAFKASHRFLPASCRPLPTVRECRSDTNRCR